MKTVGDSAVSPVVGVMLMLVVTIIIAAVVSAFAGGLTSDSSKAPQATLSVTGVIEGIEDTAEDDWVPTYPANFTAKNGLLFEHKGGDGFALSGIYVQIQSQDTKYDISSYDKLPAANCTGPDVTSYLVEVGDNDGYISPGDKFMLYADNCRIDHDPTYGYNHAPQISWKPEGAAGGIAAYLNTLIEYKIIDKASGKAIQSGSLTLH
ncbi:type IV pilin N-terminal domain-containing protein [Methanoculleus sp. UBA312]|uniref:type IV pilin N-terminal domain-containing protein n=1 Tax=Methanoculleus sp. UBA312 TaxID=1915499 RepID=UPI0031BB4A38